MFILLKGPQSGLASGVKVEFCLSVVGELVGSGGAISQPLSMLKNALKRTFFYLPTIRRLSRSKKEKCPTIINDSLK